MKNKEEIAGIIKEAESLRALFEKLISCFDELTRGEQRALMRLINNKIIRLRKTDREASEPSARLVRSERLAAMGQMAAAVGHELKNPLSGIKIAAEYLSRRFPHQPEVLDIISNIQTEVVFATNIVSNILEFAKIGKPCRKLCSLKNVIEEAVLSVAQQGCFKNIEIKKEFPEQLPPVSLDALQMRQVFMNLFINAAEAMVGGGCLTIGIKAEEQWLAAVVADTGCGISREDMEHIFGPFFSKKMKGIGLGLAISREIVENHDGTIDVESRPGKGTVFYVRLPAGGGAVSENGGLKTEDP